MPSCLQRKKSKSCPRDDITATQKNPPLHSASLPPTRWLSFLHYIVQEEGSSFQSSSWKGCHPPKQGSIHSSDTFPIPIQFSRPKTTAWSVEQRWRGPGIDMARDCSGGARTRVTAYFHKRPRKEGTEGRREGGQ